jgi:hypothetical protein
MRRMMTLVLVLVAVSVTAKDKPFSVVEATIPEMQRALCYPLQFR